MYRALDAAHEKRHALELLEDLNHTIVGRGPEGEQTHRDKRGMLVKGEGSVTYEALATYRRDLMLRAGLELKERPPVPVLSGVSALNQLAALLGQKGLKS